MKTYFTVEYYDGGKTQGAQFTTYEDAISWARDKSYNHPTHCTTSNGVIAQFENGKASPEFEHLNAQPPRPDLSDVIRWLRSALGNHAH